MTVNFYPFAHTLGFISTLAELKTPHLVVFSQDPTKSVVAVKAHALFEVMNAQDSIEQQKHITSSFVIIIIVM